MDGDRALKSGSNEQPFEKVVELTPLRICLFTPNFLPDVGGAETAADLVARGLIKRNHDVQVVAQIGKKGRADVPYPVCYYHRPPSQHLWPEVLAWPLCRAWFRRHFDVILSFYAYPTGYAATVVSGFLRVGVVIANHGGELHAESHLWQKRRVPRLIRRAYERANRIIVPSRSMANRLEQVMGRPMENMEIVGNAIDAEALRHQCILAQRRPPALSITRPFILHLGSVKSMKGQMVSVEAISRLRKEFEKRDMTYVFVGEGKDLPLIREQISRLGLEHVARVIGRRTGLEKAWLLANADFLVSTSLAEGQPMVLIEAMACGLPALVSDIPAHRELIKGRCWARVFSTGDAADLAEQMDWMMKNDLAPWRIDAARHGREYSLDHMIRGYEMSCAKAASAFRSMGLSPGT